MGPIGPTELIVILVIALLILGPKKLPEVGKSLGKGMREFKDSLSSADGFKEDPPAPRERTPSPSQVTAGTTAHPIADPAEADGTVEPLETPADAPTGAAPRSGEAA